jgi:hypothetical protein
MIFGDIELPRTASSGFPIGVSVRGRTLSLHAPRLLGKKRSSASASYLPALPTAAHICGRASCGCSGARTIQARLDWLNNRTRLGSYQGHRSSRRNFGG